MDGGNVLLGMLVAGLLAIGSCASQDYGRYVVRDECDKHGAFYYNATRYECRKAPK